MISEPLNATRHGRIASTLQGIVGRVLRIEPQDIDIEAPFLELGADSLALVEALRGLQDAFGVKMTIRQLFEQFPTISLLAAFLDQTLPAEAAPASAPAPVPVQPVPAVTAPAPVVAAPLPALPPGAASGMERVFGLQIQAFNQLVAQQLQRLGGRPQAPVPQPPAVPAPAAPAPAALKPVLPTYLGKAGKAAGAALTERQQRHLDALVERYCRKTAKSKELTQRYRSVLADSRATVGFRPTNKEMLYPLARAGGKGSRLWDIDGNEYVDLTMGMGVHLLGHAPDFLQETFERQVREGFELGPRSAHSGEVAALFCELTGMERATFTNSGTEACMTAIRLARARTGRTKIVMFAGSYHGHSDGTLAQSQEIDGELRSFPVAPGIPQHVAEDVMVLDYGTPHALEIIRKHRHELAAVMVEPIQSRRPDLQPAEFLHELRRLTAESGIALIFDEMICGFRLHLGGAQAHFGIRADLATYGKIVGGGLPIGVVAGSAEYMDGIDGGTWQYGDDSRPERETTFFGGTFCQHPLSMSAAREVLAYLKRQGPSLQEGLNATTGRFVGRLNDFFTADKVPIKAVHAHSLFRFNFAANAELLYYHLVEKGVYVWEWRNNFLSTAHTDEDLDFVLNAVRESVEALREGGFLPDRPSGGPGGGPGGGGEKAKAPKAEAFWGRQGIKPGLTAVTPAASASGASSEVPTHGPPAVDVRFSLYFFGNYAAEFRAGKYDLLVDCARFADREGFAALWFPERHFHAFGGFCPNPSVLASALARETERVALRAGSVVLPLHHPLRVAEEWSLVDNLSGGRIGLAYASGWHPNDFALAPESYGRHRDLTFENAETIRRLWRGEAVRLKDGAGTEVDLRIYPLPARRDLPVWITIVNNPDTYRLAGEMGAGVLTNLMGQTIEGLAANLAVYREALAAAGHPPEAGRVTLLLHTFVGPDAEAAVAAARRPFYSYLESSVGLVKSFAASEGLSADFDRLSREDFEYMLELAYQRYVKTAALIGSPETCAPIVERMRSLGVDEIACLVDFGVDAESVRASLPWIAALKDRFPAQPAVPEPEAVAPLTESQRDLYTVAQIGVEASLAYLESGAVEMRGPLDLPAFLAALRQAAGRHEALRAVVPDEHAQVFRPSLELETPVVDVSALPANRREEAAAFWIESAARRPFDLARGPLIRTSVLRLGPQLHRLGLFVHHIAADGLSLSLLLDEVFAVYEAARAGCRAALHPAMRYRDYVAWLAAGGDEPDALETHEAWWLGHLAAPLPVFEPPTDRPRPALRSFRGSRRRLALDPALRDGLRAVGRRHGATLYAALLAAWSVLLHRWTGQDDLVVGGPAARRPLAGGDRLVGHCVDLVAFRSRLDGEEPPFSRYLVAMRSQVLDVQEHGSVPFARLMSLLKLPADPGRAPLIQTVFNFDPGLGLTRAGGLELAEVSPPVPHVKFDLAVHVLESGESPLLQLDYRTDLFDAATMDRLLERFVVLLGGIVAAPETALGDLPLLTASEREQVLAEWSGSETAYPRETPVHRIFEEVAARQPDAPAVLSDEGSLTYGELARRARSLAHHLRAMGVGPETPVALDLERSPELITGMLAVLEAGGFYVPLDPADSSERRAWLLEDSRAKVVLTAKDIKDCKDARDESSWESSGGDALAYVLYTSGSTGRPKGVAVPHRAINRLVLETDYVRLGPGDRTAHLSNTAFDASTFEVWGALLTGAALVIFPRETVLSPAALGAAFRRWEISASFLTAALFNEVLREAPGSLGGVRNQLAGGEALSPRWVREALTQLEPGCRLLNGYGPTECTTFAVVHDIRSAPEGRSIPIGRPIANTRAWVLDREMRPVPQGAAGELLLGGDGLARGYWGRPDLTAERFVPDPFDDSTRLYRTGDLVRWLADGALEYLGRTDEQVKVRGFRIEPGEIEAVLSRCPGIGECAVVAREEAEGKTLLAFATRSGSGPDPRAWLRERLPDYMVPSRVVLLETLPRTSSAKIDRRALLGWAPPEEEPETFEGPRTPAEELIAGVWAEVLGRERVGRRESFLDLGGHSLSAGRMLNRLGAVFGVTVTFPEFFLEPTVEALARRLGGTVEPEVAWRGVLRDFPTEVPVHRVFEEVAARQPGAPAVVWDTPEGERSLSYGELARDAARLAVFLRELGVAPGMAVALDMPRSPEMITAMIAVLQAGAFYVPLDPNDASERRDFILEDSGSAVVLKTEDVKSCKDSKDQNPALSLESLQSFVSWAGGGLHLAYMIYTSGSTGRPKGVAVTHRGVNRLVLNTDYFHAGPGDRITNLVTMTFDVSTWEVWGGLLLGAAVVVVPRELVLEPPVLADWLVKMRADVCFLPVSVFNEVVRERPRALASIRELFSGGEALTPHRVREALRYLAPGHRLVNGYGPTECTCWALTHVVEALEEGRSVPIGRPIVNTTAYILDRELRPIELGEPGELCLGGPGVAQGYWNRPDLTADKFVPDPFGEPGDRLYRTGDLARWLPDGTVEYLGRTDHQVKIRGYRIEPGEIESVLAQCPGVAECAVVVREEPEGRSLMAFVVSLDDTAPDARAWLRERLPEHMVPARFAFHGGPLPKTSSGKIDRRALQALASAAGPETMEEASTLEAPRTPVEEVVAGAWSEVLGLERVDTTQSFFNLGGHSLLAGRVLARLRAAFGVDLPLRLFFVEPTVRGLARRVEEARQEQGFVPIAAGEALEGGEPLSFAQHRLWFFDRLAPGSALYNMPALLRIAGPLRVDLLTAAVAEVVRRHDTLRTVFHPGAGDEPVQLALPDLPGPVLPVVDLSGLPGGARRAEADRCQEEELRRPFALEQGPLFRTLLLRLGPEEHRAILHAHHIVSDGWSLGVLYEELGALYRAFEAGRPSPLPALPLRYADYAVWQREWLQGGVLEEQLAWWRERLAGLGDLSAGGLDMPADRPRPAEPSWRGALIHREIPAGLAGSLLQLARRHGATPFMVLAAAWLALVHRHTDREDLALGFPTANRTRPEIEPLIGFFVNTLVLRARVSGESGFLDLLGRVREAALGAWAHQDVPFERLVEAAAPERDLSRSPLFQVLIAYQGGLGAGPDLGPGLSVRAEEPDTGTSKFDLSLFVREVEGGTLVAELEYSSDLFDEATARRFLERFETLLGGVAADPGSRVADLPLLAATERSEVLSEWSGSEAPYPRETPVHRVFEQIAARRPEAPAVLWDGGSLTYGELDRWSSAVAARLEIPPGTPVALEMERSAELIVAMLGVLKAGGAYVPLDPADASERRAWLLENSRAEVVLRAKDIKDCKDSRDHSLQSFESFPLGGDALAYILYTSGSTGRPKGVAVPHRAINRLILETDYIHLGPEDRSAHLSNTAFDASTLEVWGPLLTGGSMVIFPRELVLSPAALGAAFRRWKISVSFLTAALFNEVLREAPGSLGGVRNQLAGGEALSPRWVREALTQLEPGCRLLNGYGPTECTTFAVVHDIRSAPEGRSIPIGRPIANTRAYVLDRETRPVPQGAAGELLLGGDGLAWGYWGRPDLTAERFVPDPFGLSSRLYRTGDLVRWLADGTLEYLGRTDEQVKVRGFRIEPGEIESVLSRCPGIAECAVVAKQEAQGKVLVAFATRSGAEETPDVRAWLRERLPDYMVPSRVVFLDALPRTASAKVDRRALLAVPVEQVEAAERPYQPPRTPTEEVVAGIWAEVLGLERVGLGQGFFDLGGHSLLAGRVLARLRSTLGVELPLRTFFQDPTVEALARRVEEARPKPGAAAGAQAAGLPPILPVPRDGRLPLSFAQQRLWFFDRLAPVPALYNVPSLLRIDGPLRAGALAAALAEIVRRHEALRTVFSYAGEDEPVQLLLTDIPGLAVIDLSGLPEAVRRDEAGRQEREEVRRGFSLETGPLFRSRLLRSAPEEHLLILNAHHVVSDGWSLGVLSHEIGELYRAFAAGRPSPLPELGVGYPDFAVRQREWLEGGAMEDQLAWWTGRLAGLPEGLDLPADRPRPAVQTWRGAVERTRLAAGLSQSLLALGRRQGATPFMTLAAAFFVLLHRHTGGDDLAVGFPTANRTRQEIEPLIGFFVNTLVLRADLSGEPGFLQVLARVRDAALGAWAHQDLPFEKLVEALAPDRDLSRTPLVQVFFAFQEVVRLAVDLGPGLAAEPEDVDTGTAKFDLSLFLSQAAGGGLLAEVEYATDLFEAGTVRRILERLEVLLAGIVETPEAPLGELPLLTAAERKQMLVEWRGVEREYPSETPVHRVFEEVAARQPEAPAVVWDTPEGERSLSYGKLAEDAARLAVRLIERGVGPGVPVALDLPRSPGMITAMLAVLQAGGFYVPLDPEDTSERRSFILEDSGAALVLSAKDIKDQNPSLSLQPLQSFMSRAGGGPLSLAYMIYTSGSTGRPKGVAVPHRAINRLVLETDYFHAGPGDRIANLVNMTFDVSTWEVWGGLLLGAAVVTVPKELVLEPPVLADWLVKMRVDVAFLPVSVFNEVARERPEAFGAIRELFSGGEALTPRWVREAIPYIAPGHRLVNGYGPTECTCWALTHDVTELPEGRSVPIGRPIANTTACVLDRALRPVPVGVPGELCLGGPGVAQGYWNRPDLTADKFVPDPLGAPGERLYRTGDLARWLPDGTVEYLGRTDHQVKVRGYRIEPGEIESVLARCPGVAECAIVVRSGPEGKSLAAFVTPVEGATPDARGWLRARLPEYMVPAAIVHREALPKTSSGKIDRRALLAQALPDEAAETAGEAPRTPVEEIVAGAWTEVLGVERVGATESFFDLGGHSLLAGRVLARLRSAFGIDLPLRAFFADPTVRGLARRIEEARQGGAVELPPIVPIPEDARVPLSFAQQRLWFFDRLAPGSALYNMPVVLEIDGPLKIERLAEAVARIVRRHEPLRTVFVLDGDEPVQVVLPTIPGLAVIHVEGPGEAERRTREEMRRPFSLEQGPLFRSILLRFGPKRHRLILHAHHSVSDGWSAEVMLREIAALYRGEALPGLPVRYADFAVWQRDWLRGEALDAQLAWWTERLAGLQEGLDLPADHPRPAVQSYRGAVEAAELPPVSRDLLRLGRRHGATPFMTMAAAFLALIHRHTGRDDLAVGFPVAGRTRPEVEPLIGFFVNTLVLRADLSGEPTFAELLGRVRESALGAGAHQDLPFERLVEALAPERDLSRSPLVQVLFSYRSDAQDLVLAPGTVARDGDVDTGTSKFDLSLFVRETGDGFRAEAEYATDLFDRATVRAFLERFGILIGGIVAEPETPFGDLPLLTGAEREQVLVEWSGSEPAYPRETPVHQVFHEVAACQPGEPAVLWDGGRLTYGELAAQSSALARRLRDLGVGPETPVALDMERSPELIVAMLAVLEAGGFYVPLDPADSSERRAWLLEDSRAEVVLTAKDIKNQNLLSLPSLQPLQSLSGSALAYILYTSGSTGRPKGVAVPHRAINRLVLETDYVRLGPGDRTAHLSNTAFDASTFEVWGALLTGAALVIFPREVVLSPAALGEAFRRWEISASFLTAALFNEVLREAPGSLGGVRHQLAGGEALSPRWVREALTQLEPGCRLLNGYGPTECTTFAVVHDIRSAPEGRSIPIGRPIANTRAYVLDRELRPVPPGVAGELLLGGDGLARGYWGRPDLTAERFVPSPIGPEGARLYRSGDLVRWLADGTLEYLGRTDAQVKIRGFRIEPGEIESVLSRCPGIGECAVIARQGDDGKMLLAFATQAGPVPEVRAWLRERLPDYMVPSRIVLLETLPRTSSGKIDRRALLAWAPPDEEPAAFVAPRTPAEEIVAGIWSEVLERDRVGLGESFFELGGHSLLASRTLARLRSAFGVDLPLRSFFLDPTVEGVARRVEEARRSEREIPPIPRVSRDRRIPLSYAQERLWLVDQLQPGNTAYNSFLALALSGGPVDHPVLEAALAEIVRRHESLRTRIVSGPEGPGQVIDPPAPWSLPVIDLSGLEDPGTERLRIVSEEAYRPFDLAAGPLFRASLVHVAEAEHALLLNFHHIICDGWSLTEVLPVELNALYRGQPLPELPIQVPDFAVWQREQLGDVLDEQLAWWKERLGGAPPVLDLPYDHPRPAVISRGTVESLTLPADLGEGLAALGRRHGATLFMTLLAAVQTLLQRYSHEDRIAVGTAVGNRPRHETEGLIGLFLNTLVLQTDLSGDLSVRSLLERVREVTLDAFDHQDLPFEKLVAAVSPGRNLFQVLFLLQNMRVAPLDLPGLEAGMIDFPTERVQFELAFTAYEWEGRLILAAPYSTDLFDRPTIQRLLDNTRRLLEHMVEYPERPVSEAPLLSEPERRQVVLSETPAEVEEPETLETRLDRRQQELADRMDRLSPERRNLLRKWIRKG
ncbi:MAG: non-ribosomal peptide synthase/polyketide synthase [Acidobacteriota bacterium]